MQGGILVAGKQARGMGERVQGGVQAGFKQEHRWKHRWEHGQGGMAHAPLRPGAGLDGGSAVLSSSSAGTYFVLMPQWGTGALWEITGALLVLACTRWTVQQAHADANHLPDQLFGFMDHTSIRMRQHNMLHACVRPYTVGATHVHTSVAPDMHTCAQ